MMHLLLQLPATCSVRSSSTARLFLPLPVMSQYTVVTAVASDSSTNIVLRAASPDYTQPLLDTYTLVVNCGAPNFMVAKIQLPSNLNFKGWERIAVTSEDDLIDHIPQVCLPCWLYRPSSHPIRRQPPLSQSPSSRSGRIHHQRAQAGNHAVPILRTTARPVVPGESIPNQT